MTELWHEVLEGPLGGAVEAVERFGEWRPADEAGQELFARLAAADPGVIAAFAEPDPCVTIPAEYPQDLTFSPDLSEVALIPGLEDTATLEIYAVADGRLVDRRPMPDETLQPWDYQVLHVGDAIVHLERRDSDRGGWEWTVVRRRAPHWSSEVLDEFNAGTTKLAPVPGGFVVGAGEFFLFGAADGPLRGPVVFRDDRPRTLLTTDPASGRIAVIVGSPGSTYAQTELLVLDADLQVVASAAINGEGQHIHHGWFCGPDRLLTHGRWYHVKSWEVAGESLVVQRSRHLDKWEHRYASHLPPLGTTPLPGSMRVAVERDGNPPLWLDACTVEILETPSFGSRCPLWVSPGGEYVVFEAREETEIHDLRQLELADLLTRPMARVRPSDVDAVATAGSAAVLELLKACVTYRLAR